MLDCEEHEKNFVTFLYLEYNETSVFMLEPKGSIVSIERFYFETQQMKQ